MCEEATNSRADCDCEQEVRVSGRACGDACWVPSVRMGTAHSKGPFLPESWHGWGQAQFWPQFYAGPRSCYVPRPLPYMLPRAGGQGISHAPSTHRPLPPAQRSPALSGGLKLPFHLLPGGLGLSPRLL